MVIPAQAGLRGQVAPKATQALPLRMFIHIIYRTMVGKGVPRILSGAHIHLIPQPS